MLVNKISSGKDAHVLEARFMELLGMSSPYDKIGMGDLPNLQEVRETDFWWHRSCNSFKAEAWAGQIKLATVDPFQTAGFSNPAWGTLLLYLVDQEHLAGGGFAVLFNYNWMGSTWNLPKAAPGFSIKPPAEVVKPIPRADPAFPAVRYFTWQKCVHTFEEVGPIERRSRGWHVYKCSKCGASHSVDSSD